MALGEMNEAGGGRRATNTEINLVPMIDLLICSIAFLMLTAVWSTQGRLEATTQLGGSSRCCDCNDGPKTSLHVTVSDPDTFTLAWREGAAVLRTFDVPRRPEGARFPALAAALRREWASRPEGAQAPGRPVTAVLHVDHTVRFGEMAAVLDALQAQRLVDGDRRSEGAFFVSLAN